MKIINTSPVPTSFQKLDLAAQYFGTDKSSLIHNYAEKYEKYLPFQRDASFTILEIGVLGGASLRMWKAFYPNAEIVGIDITEACLSQRAEHIAIEIGSQTDEKFLHLLNEKYGPFHFVVDDGSHVNATVISTFEKLFPLLAPSGVYAVEDSCTSYWPRYGGSTGNKKTIMNYFRQLTHDVSFYGAKDVTAVPWSARRESLLIPHTQRFIPTCNLTIESINFLNSLILITKR